MSHHNRTEFSFYVIAEDLRLLALRRCVGDCPESSRIRFDCRPTKALSLGNPFPRSRGLAFSGGLRRGRCTHVAQSGWSVWIASRLADRRGRGCWGSGSGLVSAPSSCSASRSID